jgi:hypothetical protein
VSKLSSDSILKFSEPNRIQKIIKDSFIANASSLFFLLFALKLLVFSRSLKMLVIFYRIISPAITAENLSIDSGSKWTSSTH